MAHFFAIGVLTFWVPFAIFSFYQKHASRSKLIAEMKSLPLNDLDDEMTELLYNAVRKLEEMSDAEFEAVYIAPDTMMD